MNAQELSVYLEPIVSACPLWKGKKVHVVIIANPTAGGFTMKKYSDVHEKILVEYSEKARQNPVQCASLTMQVYETERAGRTANFVQKLVRGSAMPDTIDNDYLIITAGGDGTSLEVQTSLAKIAFTLAGEYADIIKNRITVLRLPFGTGNDGSDGRGLEETLKLFFEPSHFSLQRAIRVVCGTSKEKTKRHTHYESLDADPPWYAFNIASVGIDAFITHMTNKTKSIFPGDFYKLWIDLSCIFYNFLFPSKSACISVYTSDGFLSHTIETPVLFALLGVSGHRTYGSGQKIIPDDRNVCITKKMNLISKLLIKEKLKAGRHADNKINGVVLLNADKLVIDYGGSILVQMDGEVHLAEKENFPLIMEKTAPVIRIIELDSAPFYKGADPC